MKHLLPLLILLVEMLLVSLFSRELLPAAFLTGILGLAMAWRVFKLPARGLMSLPWAFLVLFGILKCRDVVSIPFLFTMAAVVLQIQCYVFMAPWNRSLPRPRHHLVSGANLAFVLSGLVAVYLVLSRRFAFLPPLPSGIIGSTLMLMLTLQMENAPRPSVHSRPGTAPRGIYRRLTVVTLIAGPALILAGMTAQPLGQAAEILQSWAITQIARLRADDADEDTENTGNNLSPRAAARESIYHDINPQLLELKDDYNVKNIHKPVAYVIFHQPSTPNTLLRERVYLKVASFDTFVDRQWTTVGGTRAMLRDEDDGQEDGSVVLRPYVVNPVVYSVCTRRTSSGLLPGIASVASVHLPAVARLPNDVYASPVPIPMQRFSYTMTSSPLTWRQVAFRRPSKGHTDPRYAMLQKGRLSDRIRTHTAAALGGARGTRPILTRLLTFLHANYTYSLQTRNPEGRHAVENFLFHEKKGHCELFASSFVLMARAAGIPARMTVGYAGGEYDTQHKILTFHADNAHAWAEVYLADFGWTTIDPTPPAAAAAPTAPRTVQNASAVNLANYPPIGNAIGLPRPAGAATGRSWQRIWSGPAPPIILVNLVLILAVIIAVGMRSAQRWHDVSTSQRWRTAAHTPGFFRKFCRHFAKAGYRYRAGQTPGEYLRGLKRRRLIGDEFDDMLDYLYRISYANAPRSHRTERGFELRLRSLPSARQT